MYPLVALVLSLVPTLARAEGFVPIAPIKLDGALVTQGSVTEYLNTLFELSIAAGAVLAVLMIVRGGFEYMTTEASQGKGDAKSRITSALLGLFLLLAITLILYVINPALICLRIFDRGGCGGI